jgi:hypothetical protein
MWKTEQAKNISQNGCGEHIKQALKHKYRTRSKLRTDSHEPGEGEELAHQARLAEKWP